MLRPNVDQRKSEILEAAVQVIIDVGFTEMTVADVAKVAGVSTALVHYHFATREALLAEALVHSFDRAGDHRAADTGEAQVMQRLHDMVEQCLPLPGEQEDDWVLWVELWLRAVRHPDLRPTAARLYVRMHTWFTEAIEQAIAEGELAPCDAGAVADRVLALIDGYGIRALLGDPAMPLERARQEVWAALAPVPARQ
jgi:AcrR family transcriptional regulator